MSVCARLAIVLLWTAIANVAASTAGNQDVKRYSYICLQDQQNLCLGISPGEGEPYFNQSNPFLIQLKQRLNNEAQALDYKKTRWDVRFQEQMVSLSRFPDLCMSLRDSTASPNELGLYPCRDVANGTRLGRWDMQFNTNINEVSTIQVVGGEQCVTAMMCSNKGSEYCDQDSEVPVTGSEYRSGAFVKTKACWWSSAGDPKWKAAQTFVQAIDCAVGCTPMLQNNDVCDLACANAACKLDNFKCLTAAPTPPTFGPTSSPTNTPTARPTTRSPSGSPITSKPSVAPTAHPTRQPTSRAPSTDPTSAPTRLPTYIAPTQSPEAAVTSRPTSKRPSKSPSLSAPSSNPTKFPSESPSAAPTKSPEAVPDLNKDPATPAPTAAAQSVNAAVVVAVAVPLLLLLLLCLVGLVVVRERRRRKRNYPKAWSSLIDVNQAAYVEHHLNKRKPVMQRIRELFSGKKEPAANVTALSSHLAVDHIIVTAGSSRWEPAQPESFRSKNRRTKLIGKAELQ